jgi:hypothetical protein
MGVLAGNGQQHRDSHRVQLVIRVDLAGVRASAKLIPGENWRVSLLETQLADCVIGSGSQSKRS